ncbi:MAG: hypothetical protein FHOMOCKG_00089 [Methanophagales virus GBV302]|uniref:DUF2341 domain-containing protein n=1 Tax=Methanophagales virus GBV302 TaxID=2999281 RepID=A0A9E8V8A0_9CAUD|nr:MAG: hypothetical protein QIT37_gp089 [Methanophagales virus GBV302]WAE39617.1 MAG: hypothetical protein FHOMOCKG_00089 [Methanophagales virus GBV302]
MAWLDPWGIRQKVKVTNNSGRYLYNYQILIELTSSNFDFENCKSDGSDIRFTESDGVTELPYWIEKWDSENKHARVWVRVFVLPPLESFLFLYYGNPEAESESNGDLTFKFFDDFENDDLSSWIKRNWYGTVNYWIEDTDSHGKVLHVGQSSKTTGILFKEFKVEGPGFKLDYEFYDVDYGHGSSQEGLDAIGLSFFSSVEGDANDSDNYTDHIHTYAEGFSNKVQDYQADGSIYQKWNTFKYSPREDHTWTNLADLYSPGQWISRSVGGANSNIKKVRIFVRHEDGYKVYNDARIDNLRLRKYVEPEPVVELGEIDKATYPINSELEISLLFDGRQGGKFPISFQETISPSISSSLFVSALPSEFLIDTSLETEFRCSFYPPPPHPYSFRFPIMIENDTGDTLYNFQIPVEINTSNFNYSLCNKYGSDINFFTEDYSQELPFWWEEWTYNGNSKVWIKIPEIPPGFHVCAILVCGHSQWEYIRPEQPKEVFLFYDGFERSDVSDWTFEFFPSDSGEPYYGVADACHGDYELKAGFKENCENPHVTVKQTVSLPSGEKVLNCWQKETNTGVSPTHAIYINDVEKWSDVTDSEYEDCVFIQTSSFTDSGNVEIKFTDSKDTNTKVGIRLDSIFIRKYVEPFPTATLLGKDSLIFRVCRDFQLDCLFPLEDLKKNNTIMISGRLESFPLSELSFSCSQNGTLPVSSYVPAYLRSNNFLLIPSSWKRKRNITIENNTGQTLTDYQICLTLTPENFDYENCRLDGGDLRFTNPSLKLLPYWIERWEYNGTSRIWVKVDEIPTGSNVCVFMFYDNPVATSESNAEETLEFHDDFSSPDEWSFSNDELVYVSDGLFKFEYSWSDDARAYVKNFFTLPDSFYIQFKIKIQDVLQNVSSFFVGVQDAIENEANCVGFFPNREEDSYNLYVKDDGEIYQSSMYSAGGSQDIQTEMFYNDTWYGIKIWKSGNLIHGEVWDEEFKTKLGEGEILDHSPSQMDELVVFNEKYLGIKGCLDDLFITKHASPALTVIIGDPQYFIISDAFCHLEEIVDLKLNSTYLIGSRLNLLTKLHPSLVLHYTDEFNIPLGIEFSAVPLLEGLLNVSVVMGEMSIEKKFWIWESFLQSVDISSLFFIDSSLSLYLESELMGAPCTHWLINGGNVPNLISYKVTQEWAAPDTAEVRFKGLPQFLAGDYVHIVYDTGNADYPQVTLFKGPVLTIDRELVKGREETTVRAVSSEWYLTKQNCFWDEESSLYTLDPALSLRDILLMWFGSWCKDLCCDPSHIPNTFSTVCEKWREKHGSCWSSISSEDEWWYWFNYHLGKYWKNTTGIMPFYFENIPDWKDKYVINAGKSGFNFFYGTTKWDAIMQICNVCNCVFYCLYWDDNHPIVDPWEGVQVDRGRRLALLLTRETSEDTELIEILDHPISGDDFFYSGNPLARDLALKVNNRSEDGNLISKLISVRTREEQSSEETKTNRLAVTCQDFPVITTEERGTGIKPVEEYIAISNIDVDELEDLQQFAEERLEELRAPNVTFEARFLDLALTTKKIEYFEGETRIPIHTGMYIGFDGIDGLPSSSDKDGYYRIMKITYEMGEQTGGKLLTTLECRDTDLIHPGSPKLNEIENIMHREAKKIEKGPILPGHPCPSNPRPPMLGEIPWIEIGEVVGYDPEQQTVDVKIRKTGQVVKGVPLL